MNSTKPFAALLVRDFSALSLKALSVVLSLSLLLLGAIQAKAETIEIAVKDIAFVPAEVQAKAGDTIRWRNLDPAPHTATAERLFDVSVPVGGSGETVVGQPGS